jgi:hypothetical protein
LIHGAVNYETIFKTRFWKHGSFIVVSVDWFQKVFFKE